MGLFDHLFKSKSPSSEEASVETGATPAEPAQRSDAAARSTPPHRADPSVFLHPKSYVPRGATPLTPPGKPGAPPPVRKPGVSSAPPAPDQIVLALGDVLSRIPTPYLKVGPHDPKRELRFSINDLSSDIARGRAAVPLSRIAQLMPDIFVKEIERDEDTEVRLPLQKLVEQIGLLRSRPGGASSERIVRPVNPPALVETSHPLPDPEIRLVPLGDTAQTLEPHRESLSSLLAPAEPVIELKPLADAAAPVSVSPEPAPILKPDAEEPVPESSSAPETPAPDSPSAKAPEVVAPVEPPASDAPAPDVVEVVAVPPTVESVAEAPPKVEAETEPSSPAPVADLAPPPAETSESPVAEVPPPIPSEPILPPSELTPPAAPAPAEAADQEPVEAETGGEHIHLGLAAILRECPPEIIVGDLPPVPDNVRITLPFAPIDRQLVMGHVEISAVRFVAALPVSYQKYFSARIGVKVPIPLEEVFQNLPDPVTAALAAAQPPAQILAPSGEPGAALAGESTPVVLTPPPPPSALGGEKPEPLGSPESAPVAAPVAPEPPPVETPATPAPAPLDLPAFHLFTPPPPVIVPEPAEPPMAATIIGPEPSAENASPNTLVAESGGPAGEMLPSAFPAGEATAPAPEAGPSPSSAELPVPPPVAPMASLAPDFASPAGALPEAPAMSEQPMVRAEGVDEGDRPVASEVEKDDAPPAFTGNSAAVFAEANQTIPPPQMFRPFIILPPPIFGFTPAPEKGDDLVLIEAQDDLKEEIATEFTGERKTGGELPSETEAATLAPGIGDADESQGAFAGEELPGEMEPGVVPPTVLPSIINIDFSQALLPPDELAPPDAAPIKGVVEFPPQAPVAPESSAGPAVAEFDATPEEFTPEPIPVPPVDVAPAAVSPEAPAPDPGPAPVEVPAEAPSGGIVFMVEGHFTDHPPSAVPNWEPEPQPSVGEAPRTDAPPEPPAPVAPEAEPEPLLPLPRIAAAFAAADVLPPPALPLRRFDQDALQALFMTDEHLDLPRISRLAAQLPGVHACVIATRDQACTGGQLPDGFDLAALLGLAPRVGEAAGRMPIGALKHFTLYGDQYSVSFFERNGLSLCAVHRPRSFVPGVREKLVAIADELSRS